MSAVRTLQIGALSLAVALARPADLDAQLVAATGCGAREIATILSAGPDRAAQALRPFLVGAEVPAIGDLAREIAADPLGRTRIAELYALTAASPADAAPTAETGTSDDAEGPIDG